MAKKAIKGEFESWLESDVETAMIELKKLSDDKLDLCIGEEEQKFSITFPKDYPNTKEKFSVSSDDETLKEWIHAVNEFASKKSMKLAALLTEAAEKFVDLGGGE